MRTRSTLLVAAWLLIPTATSGGSTLSVKPIQKPGLAVMNLQAVALQPVGGHP